MLQETLVVLDRSAFRAWLLEHADQVVGTVADEHYCPLGRYLHATTGHAYDVGWVVCSWMGSDDAQPLPEWATAFIVALDCTYLQQDVTGAQALAILDTCDKIAPFPVDVPIGDEYCWSHVPGRWNCSVCARREQRSPVVRSLVCPGPVMRLACRMDAFDYILFGLLLGFLLCCQYTLLPIVLRLTCGPWSWSVPL